MFGLNLSIQLKYMYAFVLYLFKSILKLTDRPITNKLQVGVQKQFFENNKKQEKYRILYILQNKQSRKFAKHKETLVCLQCSFISIYI